VPSPLATSAPIIYDLPISGSFHIQRFPPFLFSIGSLMVLSLYHFSVSGSKTVLPEEAKSASQLLDKISFA